jgi:hypothetical protein
VFLKRQLSLERQHFREATMRIQNFKIALLATASACFVTIAAADTSFGVMGDVPYGKKALARFPALVSSIESFQIEFLIHVGDIKGGSAPCTDEVLTSRVKAINDIRRPTIFIPGDNDWTDCHRRGAGGYQPLERLQLLRELAYPNIGVSLGTPPMRLNSQATTPGLEEFREHQYWTSGNISFVALHVLGSDNGLAQFKGRTKADDDEAIRRITASINWLNLSFESALESKSDALVIAIHGNPFGMSKRRAKKYDIKPFAGLLAAVRKGAADLARPVLLIHGDTHDFKFDQPLRDSSDQTISNIYRLEGIGSPAIGWVEVTFAIEDPEPFQVKTHFISN